MGSFMTWYHVHEKHILLVTIPMSLACLETQKIARFSCFFLMVANFSLFPLLHEAQHAFVKFILFALHALLSYVVLDAEIREAQQLSLFSIEGISFYTMEKLFLLGFLPIQLFYSIGQEMFLPHLPF